MKELLNNLWLIIKWLFSLLIQFPDYLGLTDWMTSHIICGIVIVVLMLITGTYLTTKTKRRILGIIVDIVGFVSAISMFAS